MRRLRLIFLVGLAPMGIAGCASRVVPRDQLPPDVAAQLPEDMPYREYTDGLDGWLRFSAPLTREMSKSIGESARANEASASTDTPGK